MQTKECGKSTSPIVAPVIWRNLSVNGKSVDAAMQKTLAKFLPGMTAIIQQLDILAKNRKEVKSNPILKEVKRLSTYAIQMFSHAVASTNQLRKDVIKPELDPKFHALCDSSHSISEQQLFRDKLNAELKEMDDTKRFNITKRYSHQSSTSHWKSEKSSGGFKRKFDQQDFHRGYGKNHKPKRTDFQANKKKDTKPKWSQKRQY